MGDPAVHLWTRDVSGPSLILPDGCLDVIVRPDGEAVVAGPDVTAREHDEPGCHVGVRFSHGLGPLVLGVPADELTGRVVPLVDVVGRAVPTPGPDIPRRSATGWREGSRRCTTTTRGPRRRSPRPPSGRRWRPSPCVWGCPRARCGGAAGPGSATVRSTSRGCCACSGRSRCAGVGGRGRTPPRARATSTSRTSRGSVERSRGGRRPGCDQIMADTLVPTTAEVVGHGPLPAGIVRDLLAGTRRRRTRRPAAHGRDHHPHRTHLHQPRRFVATEEARRTGRPRRRRGRAPSRSAGPRTRRTGRARRGSRPR